MVKNFDYSLIEEVNRIQLKPGEMVLFRTSEHLEPSNHQQFFEAISETPLQGRVLLFQGDWKIDVIDPGEEE